MKMKRSPCTLALIKIIPLNQVIGDFIFLRVYLFQKCVSLRELHLRGYFPDREYFCIVEYQSIYIPNQGITLVDLLIILARSFPEGRQCTAC